MQLFGKSSWGSYQVATIPEVKKAVQTGAMVLQPRLSSSTDRLHPCYSIHDSRVPLVVRIDWAFGCSNLLLHWHTSRRHWRAGAQTIPATMGFSRYVLWDACLLASMCSHHCSRNLTPSTHSLSTGLLLQLLVNPQMETASKLLLKVWKSASHIGPIRVWRWGQVLFYPLAVVIFHFVEKNVWMQLVSFSNRTLKQEEVHPTPRRSSINPRRSSIYGMRRVSSSMVPGIVNLSYASSGSIRLSTSISPANEAWQMSTKKFV